MTINHSIDSAHSNHSRQFQKYTWVYPVLSRRSGGISIGINLNLNKKCNFNCAYCQVDRKASGIKKPIDINKISSELASLLGSFDEEGICRLKEFSRIPDSKKHLKDLALSGDGEPTSKAMFPAVCKILRQYQDDYESLKFKIVLITNSSLFHKSRTQEGIRILMGKNGEIWAKLDAGTQEWFEKVNGCTLSLNTLTSNLIKTAQLYPVTIQTLICSLWDIKPSHLEINAYIQRINRITLEGGKISKIQLYTLARQSAQPYCKPVSGGFLKAIADNIQINTGIEVEAF